MRDTVCNPKRITCGFCQILPDGVVKDDPYVLSGNIGQNDISYLVNGIKGSVLIDNVLESDSGH